MRGLQEFCLLTSCKLPLKRINMSNDLSISEMDRHQKIITRGRLLLEVLRNGDKTLVEQVVRRSKDAINQYSGDGCTIYDKEPIELSRFRVAARRILISEYKELQGFDDIFEKSVFSRKVIDDWVAMHRKGNCNTRTGLLAIIAKTVRLQISREFLTQNISVL